MSRKNEGGIDPQEETEKVLLRHAARYPRMQPQDAVKLLYQSEFGAGHLLSNPAESLLRLRQESQAMAGQPGTAPLFEEIGGGFCRLNLQPAGAEEAVVPAIHRIFAAGAKQPCGTTQGLEAKLLLLQQLTQRGGMPFSAAQLADYLETYRRQGLPMVSHSKEYHAAYHPAYRVVPGAYAQSFALISAIEDRLSQNLPLTLAIDGLCGSGKTTFATLLAGLYDCNIIEMDHFFLPAEKRTPQRLAQPGGNIDYERFKQQVARHLGSGRPFSYQVFDCGVMNLVGTRQVQSKALTICEGSYSHHPHFGQPYNLKVFMTCAEEVQKKRLMERAGAELYKRFIDEWIPLEQAYFTACRIKEKSHFVLDTTSQY